ncbi:Metallo-dependent hydrolase [Macroventuria anomochaeta]|uniref:Metallo-dependent hydrolase n=1 Tax=Macroventuria anomochaeta TaxID=301207 RepID=A0ACB6RJE4_9PLEO|nr:Metallo-dependent hydrolase [Macroventuria anomochaeta]KAF2621889.1 Metallo-dependent hydrolase [Macroventuria anomochaeta]
MVSSSNGNDGPFPWHLGVYDAHCHPTDIMSNVSKIQNMKARCLTVMATRGEDQDLVIKTAAQYGIKSGSPDDWPREECIEDLRIFNALPDPTPFSVFLSQTRKHLEEHPYALLGEVGLDRSFRIPEAWVPDLWATRNSTLTPGGREGRRLTPFRCQPAHQKEILKRQLQLAAELGRAVSVHGVQAHGLVYESLHELWKGYENEVLSKREKKKRGKDDPSVEAEYDKSAKEGSSGPKPYPPRICLHSYSGSASNFKQYLNPAIPIYVFASFSTAINLGDALDEETPAEFEEMINTVPDEMLLVESDLHTAGDEMDRRLEDIVRRICKIKQWGLEEGVERLGKNWKAFVFGDP